MKKIYNKILLATDGSEDAVRATHKAIKLKKTFNSKVVAFHSVEHHMIPRQIPLMVPYLNVNHYMINQTDYTAIRDAYKKNGEKILAEVKQLFDEENLEVEVRLIDLESPEDYITRMVKEEEFDLVILGCKGEHSKLKARILGTTATKVVNDADCDVLIIR